VTATGPDGVRRPFGLLAATVAGIALASLPRGTGPIALWVGGLVGSTCAVWAAHPSSLPASAAGARVDPAERVARFLPLVCLLPVLTMPVAPGADMAMHVALARALSGGATELSVAWPGVAPPLYPRGFSGLIALFWSLGPGRAGLLASGLAYVLYALGAARLFTALGMKRPYTVAAITLFLAKTPQDVFAWGGNATVLALALGLHAAASLAAPAADRRTGVSAGLLLSGAGAVHPMGALIGAIVAGATTVRARAWGPGVTALGALAVTLTLIALAGPTLSAAEREWIVNWGRTREAVLRAAPWQFPLSVWLAFPRVLGVPWTAAVLLAASCLVLASPGRKLVGRVVAGPASCRSGRFLPSFRWSQRWAPSCIRSGSCRSSPSSPHRCSTRRSRASPPERPPSAPASSSRSQRRSTSAGTSARARWSRRPTWACWPVPRRARRATP
jgi:hypothetical protein